MTSLELELVFKRNNVPNNYYSFAGMGGGDCYVLERTDSWNVYYSERGSKYDEEAFDTEDAACRSMFDKVAVMVEGGQHRSISINKI